MRFGCIAAVRRAEGDPRRAFEAAEAAIDAGKMLPFAFIGIKLGLIGAIESAFDLGDEAKAEQMLVRIESLLPGESTPFLDAVAARFGRDCRQIGASRAPTPRSRELRRNSGDSARRSGSQ